MKTKCKMWLAASALLLLTMYVVPVWRIDLEAPQFPEGLGMNIWIDHLSGDVSTINGLNHYIGMKHIDEAMFPEFGYLPMLLGILVVVGLGIAASGRRGLAFVWLGLLLAGTALAMYDMYRWGYDYGHNLDPTAAIKVEGMAYQPPLIGWKNLLNFTAYSYPHLGGAALGLSVSITVYVLWMCRQTKTQHEKNLAGHAAVATGSL